MLSHDEIWAALDRLARKRTMSPSGLAKEAGLDATTFNKSKRFTPAGKPRWPSTESIAKVLKTVNMSFEDFAVMAAHRGAQGPAIPVIGLAQAGDEGYFDDAGFPIGGSWEDVRVPGLQDENVYALQIAGDSMDPVLRSGDKILVAPNAECRRGDRVVVKTRAGEIMAKELRKRSATQIDLKSLNPEYEDRILPLQDIQWMARIIWVSQ